VYQKDLKFRDLPSELKARILEKIPNRVSQGGYSIRINNRVHYKGEKGTGGWKGHYECATDPKQCEFSRTISVSEDDISNPISVMKKPHSCAGGMITCSEMIDAKPEMIEMVKVLATQNATTSPPMIAADVMKHFEEKYSGKAFSSVDRNYMEIWSIVHAEL
jgi:hypothetical protein